MCLFAKWLRKTDKKNAAQPMPSFDEIVDMMFDKELSFSADLQVIRVLYNEDRTKRFVLLRSAKGFYKYTYETLCVCDEEEWQYICKCNMEAPCPAHWGPRGRFPSSSFFGTEEEAMSELVRESVYKQYFECDRSCL